MNEDGNRTVVVERPQANVDFFVHENAMMHKDVDNERMHGTIRTICITFIAIIVIFVTAYTVRTSIWLDTINRMTNMIVEMSTGNQGAGPEVDDATVHQQPD